MGKFIKLLERTNTNYYVDYCLNEIQVFGISKIYSGFLKFLFSRIDSFKEFESRENILGNKLEIIIHFE